MSLLDGWDLDQYRAALRRRAGTLRIDPRVQVRFDESDLVQETLMKAVQADQSPCKGTSHDERIAWLFAIQENLLLDKYDEQFAQKRDLRREVDVTAMQRAFVDSTADFVSHGQAGSPALVRTRPSEEKEILAKLLERLPSREREVLALEAGGFRDDLLTAGRLDVSDGVVAGRIARATKRLAEMSEAFREGDDDG